MAETVILVVGGGLAGCEAAWQAARRGVKVHLMEMRPGVSTPAHRTGLLSELVCSNSLKSERSDTPAGLLKAELARAGSLILSCAHKSRVPAGGALAVDRALFAGEVTRALEADPRLEVIREELTSIERITARAAVIATGPLTSPSLARSIAELCGQSFLYFYDAVSPVFLAESLDHDRLFPAVRYGKGEPDYLNCPLAADEYAAFSAALAEAEVYPARPFEEPKLFGGCLPLEEMARAGPETLAHGPLRPVGIIDPRTRRKPYAVVQLRVDNRHRTLYGAVGFQTRLRRGEQRRVFRLVPALRRARFARYGSVHRNTYVCAPRLLCPTLEMGLRPGIFMAGSLVGAEGYMEAVATGLVAGINASRFALGEPLLRPPPETMLGALIDHVTGADPGRFQPMNASFGLLPPSEPAIRERELRRQVLSRRALEAAERWLAEEAST